MAEDAWRPANEAELIMYHALLRADSARYFQTVASGPLYLAAVSAGERRLVTWERDGRTHLLAFTSPEGLGQVIGADADTILTVSYPQLVRDWPDAGWWLALNPDLPIDAVLPVESVGEAAQGAIEIPLGASEPASPPLTAPANELEEAMAAVLTQGNVPLLLDLLAFAEVLLPTMRPVAGPVDLDDPYFPWCALPLSDAVPVTEPAIGVFTSQDRLADAAAGASVPVVTVPFLAVALAWPDPSYALIVNPGSELRARLPGDQVVALPEWARISARYHGLSFTAAG